MYEALGEGCLLLILLPIVVFLFINVLIALGASLTGKPILSSLWIPFKSKEYIPAHLKMNDDHQPSSGTLSSDSGAQSSSYDEDDFDDDNDDYDPTAWDRSDDKDDGESAVGFWVREIFDLDHPDDDNDDEEGWF